MKRLSSLNGWQRLWLVGTAIGLAYSLTVVPLNAVRDMRNWQYRSGIGYDYNSPACQSYIVQPFDALTEPPFGSGGTCWYIFTSRQFSAGHEIPATYADWEAKDERRIWREGFSVAALMGGIAIACSALIYAAGAIIGWILRGFTTSS